MLRKIFEERKDKTMFIAGDGVLRYGDIVEVIDAAKGAGVEKVGIITEGMRARRRGAGGRQLAARPARPSCFPRAVLRDGPMLFCGRLVPGRGAMPRPPRLALLGLPWDRSSSFERGAAAAPPHIRRALWSPSTNTSSELGIAIEPATLDDRGDLALGDDPAAARAAIERGVAAILADGGVPLLLGGDHSVTYPVLRAFRTRRAGVDPPHRRPRRPLRRVPAARARPAVRPAAIATPTPVPSPGRWRRAWPAGSSKWASGR